jgi:hypothetical protein
VVPGSVFVRKKPLCPKRHTIIRGAKVTERHDGEPETDTEHSSETPAGYCQLDLSRFYDVASIEYLLKGKVRQNSKTFYQLLVS